MEKKPNTIEYKVPLELFADILRILLKNKISNQVVGIKERTNVILLKIHYGQDNKLHNKAKENIESLLNDFSEYLGGLSDAVLYAEESE
jgi:hypothetical protein